MRVKIKLNQLNCLCFVGGENENTRRKTLSRVENQQTQPINVFQCRFEPSSHGCKASDLTTTPGACFSKVPKLFGRISGDIILFVSSKRRRLEVRNFAVIFIYIPFTTYEKTQLYRVSRSEFYEWLFCPEKFSGLSRNGAPVPQLNSTTK